MAKSDGSDVGAELVKHSVITQADLDEAQKREKSGGAPWYRQLLQMKKVRFDSVNDLLHYEFHTRRERSSHKNLGKTLVEQGILTEKDIQAALTVQKRNGKLLGTVLVEEGFVTPEQIGAALSVQHGLEFAPLNKTPSRRPALDAVPEAVAKQKQIIPVQLEGDVLTVLIAGPQSPARLKDLGVILGKRIHPKITAVEDMDAEIEARYAGRKTAKTSVSPPKKKAPAPQENKKIVRDAKPAPREEAPMPMKENKVSKPTERGRFQAIAEEAQGVSVVKLVATIIEGAVNSGATDIHLDPAEPEMRVRYRIDGVLHDIMSIPKDIENAVISRVKIMADVDITETRHPQDGHISTEIDEREFDIRVATLPTYLGERIVLRLLDQTSVLQGLSDLGLEDDDMKKLKGLIEQPYGMILVTGPTGSGKTTTLYSCLNEKNVMTDSIVTLEDPVEYQLSGINQVQIDPDIGRTFASVLRASLRQDIDCLLVGEIRDPETARIAVRAAMTGHLVFSTLHTNDAPEAIATLRNMDVPSYLLSSALTAVVGQRLVRKICDNCKKAFTPTKTLLKSLHLPESTKKLYRGEGCEECHHTGSRGRTGIFEVIEITGSVRTLIAEDAPLSKIMSAAKLKTMADRCRQKVKEGQVAPEELLRVIRT